MGRSRLGKPASLDRKLAGVLAYLTLEGMTPRSRIAELFWPSVPSAAARQSLRQALTRLPDEVIEGTDPVGLASGMRVDLLEFQSAVREGGGLNREWFSGALLEGLEFGDCEEFNEWLMIERERLEALRLEAFVLESARLERHGEFEGALELARRALEREPLSEENHRRLMRLHDRLGDRAAALRAFEHCRTVLREELGLEPTLETQRLAVLVSRGIRPAGVSDAARLELPARLGDHDREWRALVEAAKILESLGRTQGAFQALLGACHVLSEIEVQEPLEALIERLFALAQSERDRAEAWHVQSLWYYQRGDFTAAHAASIEGSRHARAAQDARLEASLLNERAGIELRLDRVDDALGLHRQAVGLLRAERAEAELATALADLGLALSHADRYAEAIETYLEADAILEAQGRTRSRVTVLHNLAMSLKSQGRSRAALEPLEIARHLMHDLPGLTDDERYGLANRAEVLLNLGEYADALACLERAEVISLERTLPCSFVHFRRALVHLALGEADRAESSLAAALASPGVHARGEGFGALLRARAAIQRGLEPMALLDQAEAHFEGQGLGSYRARLWFTRAEIGSGDARIAHAEGALEASLNLGLEGLELSARARLSRLLVDRGRLEEAEAQAVAASGLIAVREPLDATKAEVWHDLWHVQCILERPEAIDTLGTAARWLLETASQRIPPSSRETFMKKAVHHAVLRIEKANNTVPDGLFLP